MRAQHAHESKKPQTNIVCMARLLRLLMPGDQAQITLNGRELALLLLLFALRHKLCRSYKLRGEVIDIVQFAKRVAHFLFSASRIPRYFWLRLKWRRQTGFAIVVIQQDAEIALCVPMTNALWLDACSNNRFHNEESFHLLRVVSMRAVSSSCDACSLSVDFSDFTESSVASG
jgi:hypothetical protein